MRKNKFANHIYCTNAIDPATTTNKVFGFVPVPGKGGKTTNATIPEKKVSDTQ